MTLLRHLLLAALASALSAMPAMAELRAILAGVSDYHHLDADLKGPRNDVRLLREVLMARGVPERNIAVLSQDGADPTRAAILSALDGAAASVGPDDTVLFYFSGHGSQAPDTDGDEQGGYDEVFLPSDAKGWSGAAQAVENGITDDDFRARAAAILATGARLVVILDACHSATGFRALGGAGVARTVAPEALGIPDTLPLARQTVAARPPLTGEFVFLYAAQSDERAFEYPQGAPEDATGWHGDFTLALARALRSAPDLTWAQAMQAARAGLRRGQASQTPDAEGPMLNAPVFGTATVPPERIAFSGTTLAAGALDGLDAGAEVAIYADALSADPMARARVGRVGMRSATLEPVGDPLPAVGYAEVTAPGLPRAVVFSMPELADPEDPSDYSAVRAEVERIASGGLLDGATFGAGPFDIGLVLSDGALALTGRDGVLDPDGPGSSPRLAPDALFEGLDRALRVHRLRAALGRAETPGFSQTLLSGGGLTVELGYRAGKRRGAGCAREAGPEQRPVADGQVVHPCDQLWVHLSNGSLTARDVTILYVDSANRVSALWPTGNLSNRLLFNEKTEIGVQIVEGAASAGREELIVIAAPAREGAPRTVLTALADPAPSRATGGSAVAEYLLSAADPSVSSRNFSFGTAPDPVEVTRFRLVYQSIEREN